jgi:hypothetical protein
MSKQDGIDSILEWPTLSEETELLSDEMAEFLRSNPVAYAGHRILANVAQVSHYEGTTEQSEVPFLDRWSSQSRCLATGCFGVCSSC